MKKWTVIWIVVAFMLMILACGTAPGSTNSSIQTETPTNVLLPIPTATVFIRPSSVPSISTDTFQEDVCDPSIETLALNSRVSKRVQGGSYPDSCEVFCLCVSDGSMLEIGISDFVVDLDIFIDVDLSILQYEDNGRWESDAFGTVNEQISIQDPGGCYYIKVCSYEGEPGTFYLWNEFTP